jgi:hypothetical protein
MEFSRIREPIQKVGPGQYAIGDNPLQPQLSLDGSIVHVPTTLTISGIDFLDYLSGDVTANNIKQVIKETRFLLEEAFELDENGDLVPSNATYISDPMWILRNEDDLELRNNYWRYNMGPESFTDEISF